MCVCVVGGVGGGGVGGSSFSFVRTVCLKHLPLVSHSTLP